MDLLNLISSTPTEKISLDLEEISLPGDLDTPVSAFLKLRDKGAKFLLESAEDPNSIGRFSFIGLDPLLKIEIKGDQTVASLGDQDVTLEHHDPDNPFEQIKQLLNCFKLTSPQDDLPLLGGLVGFTSYEIVKHIEPTLKDRLESTDWPTALFYFVDTLLVFDHFTHRIRLLRLTHDGAPLADLPGHLSLDKIRHALETAPSVVTKPLPVTNGKYEPNMTPDEFADAVKIAQNHIHKGDIFQVVLSLQEQYESQVDSFDVYRALRMVNPSPYMYFLQFEDLEIIGSSPEALVKLNGRTASVRPIAGTRRRGRTPEDDMRMAEELQSDEKERAEHVMLVDLARNDLGRVSKYGTVEVNEMMTLERYSHVMHLTSNVRGDLNDEQDQFDVLRATFPAGTVSGAPKLRAMEIIADLERGARGPYAGAVGYFSLSGDMDVCITIRTLIRRNGTFYAQAGAGIVADSIPEQEYLETRNKIAVLKEAINQAERGLL